MMYDCGYVLALLGNDWPVDSGHQDQQDEHQSTPNVMRNDRTLELVIRYMRISEKLRRPASREFLQNAVKKRHFRNSFPFGLL